MGPTNPSLVMKGNYADAQLEALKKAMLAVALLALLSLLFTRRLPGKPLTAEPEASASA
jgi:hypothetical protein